MDSLEHTFSGHVNASASRSSAPLQSATHGYTVSRNDMVSGIIEKSEDT